VEGVEWWPTGTNKTKTENAMKTTMKCTWILVSTVIAAIHAGHGQEQNAGIGTFSSLSTFDQVLPEEVVKIQKAIGQFFAATSARDVEKVRAVVAKGFTAVEAAHESAQVYAVDTGDSKKLLPPEGNRDWEEGKIKLSSVKAEISSTHPSVAMASFTLTIPLEADRLADYQALLKRSPEGFGVEQRRIIEKIVADRAIHNTMFAMLARQGGQWKIVSMSFPK